MTFLNSFKTKKLVSFHQSDNLFIVYWGYIKIVPIYALLFIISKYVILKLFTDRKWLQIDQHVFIQFRLSWSPQIWSPVKTLFQSS
jgi:hypothetical protein